MTRKMDDDDVTMTADVYKCTAAVTLSGC